MVVATNLTEQYQLCNLREIYNLTEVVATPTHAAFQLGWPSTLFTLGLSILSFFSAFSISYFMGTWWFFTKTFVPFVLMFHWLVGWGFSLKNGKTGGYVAVNLFMGFLNIISFLEQVGFGDSTGTLNCVVVFLGLIQILACTVQFFGTLLIISQRWQDLGTVAYNITDAKGCLPHDGFGFLERGARSHAFRSIQTAQVVWAYVIFLSLAFLYRGKMNEDFIATWRAVPAVSIFIISIPISIYEIVIATQGRPVVFSGDCMLAELDPKLGFWDSRIETWWKVVSTLGGL